MMLEWKDPDGTAARCLACLASRMPRLRLTAARALEALAEPGAFALLHRGPGQRPGRQARMEDPGADRRCLRRDAGPRWLAAPGAHRPALRPPRTRRSRPPSTRPGPSMRHGSPASWPSWAVRPRRETGRIAVHAGSDPRAGLRGLCRAGPRAGRLEGQGTIRRCRRGGRSASGSRPWIACWRWPAPTRISPPRRGRSSCRRWATRTRPSGSRRSSMRRSSVWERRDAGGRGAGHRARRPGSQGAGTALRRRLGGRGPGRPRTGDAGAHGRSGHRGGQAA